MGNNAGQLALLAAGYLLGKSKSMRTVLMVAGGVAYGRLTASRDQKGDLSGLLGSLGGSALAGTAREVLTTTAVKGVESLNKNLQSRSEALRGSSDDETDEDVEDETTAEDEETEETEETSSKSTKSGDS